MKKNSFYLLILAFAALIGFQSCDDDDDPAPLVNAIVKEVDDIDASGYTEWVYFSFEKGETVGTSGLEETRSGTDWDIAFHRWDVRLNCGNSGSGQGGALLIEGAKAKTGWDALVVAPETGYQVDGTVMATKDVSSMPPVVISVPGSETIKGGSVNSETGELPGTWMNMTGYGQMGPNYEVTDQIFVVKTADGKYAKVWLKQYVSANGAGHITMKYAYQADGSTKLD